MRAHMARAVVLVRLLYVVLYSTYVLAQVAKFEMEARAGAQQQHRV